jgi:putative membrane protein
MKLVAKICILFAALTHLGFLFVQMFFWQSSFVQTRLLASFTLEQKAEILAHNQGLYNDFLCAGFIWGLLAVDSKVPESKARWVGCSSWFVR